MINNTVEEISVEIYKFLLNNKSINVKENSKDIYIDCPKEKKNFVLAKVLEKLEEQEIIQKIETANDTWWILLKDLQSYPQNIEIDFETKLAAVSIINKYCDEVGAIEQKTSINEFSGRDLQKIVLILEELLSSGQNKE